jgi:hypothetical protein
MRKYPRVNSMLLEYQSTEAKPGLVENHQQRLECTTTVKFTTSAFEKECHVCL